MKVLGTIIAVVGGLMVVSSIKLLATQYNLADSHDVSKAAGGLGFAIVIFALGLALRAKGKKKDI